MRLAARAGLPIPEMQTVLNTAMKLRMWLLLLLALAPALSHAGQTLNWLVSQTLGLHPIWGIEVSSRVDGQCADAVTYSWGPSQGQGTLQLNSHGSRASRCGGSNIGGMSSALPSVPFQASWKDWSDNAHTASVDIAKAMGPVEVYGGNLRIVINDDHLEVWFAAPDKSKSSITETFWPKKDEVLVHSTDPTLYSRFWAFRLDIRGLDWSKREVLKDFWFEWGDTPLGWLKHVGQQKRTIYSPFSPYIVYEPLPSAPLELHWTDPSGTQRDFSVPVSQVLAGKQVAGGRLSLVVFPARIELWFEEGGALASTTKSSKVLVYQTTKE